ncbi:hypothetical protein PR202_gb21120 [Eleusine coracana subsp. coracana]|uniref:Uncharacterized protein n=1 Tax=Eleusine coracana subsp. coracana TaxID=191504 RepID=A0AAV5FDY3_ELECO|nr:hypothetical protein QOZ80_7BG0602460 [Eleusine coracana subsp. coracana]GJN32605.1 hypothetical protein PR202_gb21120 [Eleusine coracana subsp. coracana]
MGQHHHLLPVAAAILAVVAVLAPGAASYPWPFCSVNNTFAANDTRYQANLNLLAATLPGNASASTTKLFAVASAGAAPDRVWAAGLCRGDVNATNCQACLTQAFRDLPNTCSYAKDATIYYDPCVLRYSSARVLSGADTDDSGGPYSTASALNVTSDLAQFNRVVANLINATAEYAAANSTRRFATGAAGFDQDVPMVYAVAQCTPDQTTAACRSCLAGMIDRNLGGMENAIYGRIFWMNCNFRYEIVPFFNGPPDVKLASPFPPAPAPAPAPTTVPPTVQPRSLPGGGELKGRKKYNVPVVVPAVLLPVLAAFNLAICLCLWRRRRRGAVAEAKTKKPYPMYSNSAEADDDDDEMVDSMMMDVSTLRAATGDFDDSNKLGEGGFGAVYKGVLPDGEEIAVKRLSQSSTQGEVELKNELELVAKLKHRNLVRLVGVCLEQKERLLVYEYVPNRSLDLILFGSENENENQERREQLDWEQRYRIINGIARGLQYLHEDSQLKVVHRDLKTSNILLDANMNPKISDFGLARIFERDQTQAVTSQVVGTYGYMAPEYAMQGNYSVKSDAFSFGVIVLEIVTGRNNNDCYESKQSGDLLTTVWEHWEAGTVMELVDPSMNGSFAEGDLLRCIHIGLLCVQGDPVARPEMSSVVMMLGSDTVALQAPSKPAFYAKKGGPNTTISTVSLQG